jgi:hypothetical protein
MDRERKKDDPDSLTEIWRSAEHRRAEDIGAWLSCFFEQRRRLRTSDTETPYPQGNPVIR